MSDYNNKALSTLSLQQRIVGKDEPGCEHLDIFSHIFDFWDSYVTGLNSAVFVKYNFNHV